MKKIIASHHLYMGKYKSSMCAVELEDDKPISINPFDKETPNTIFVDEGVVLRCKDCTLDEKLEFEEKSIEELRTLFKHYDNWELDYKGKK